MQQLSGINVLVRDNQVPAPCIALILAQVYYFPRILTTDLGMAHGTALQLGAGLALTYWVFSLIPWLWLDRISRRKPLILGALGCSLCFLVVRFHSLPRHDS
jgi:hypothetical protein